MSYYLSSVALSILISLQAIAEPLRPIHSPVELDDKLVALGKKLFHDPNLSLGKDVACASCHPIGQGGADGVALSRGTGGATTPYNTPSIYNAALVMKFGWEGTTSNLEEATVRAMSSPKAMNLKPEDVAQRLQIDSKTIVKALTAYTQALIPRNSPFDRFLLGDTAALQPEQRKGFQRFIELGCVSCHQGAGVGGNMFVRFGVMVDILSDLPEESRGRFNVTKDESDRHVFRVPSLRNVALTAPYFHDGRAPDLTTAVRTMAYVQLGKRLSDDDVRRLIAFLNSLTGELPPGVLP